MSRLFVLCILSGMLSILASACTQEKNFGPSQEELPGFRINSVVPPDGSREVNRSSKVIFHFSDLIDTASVDATAASLIRTDESGGDAQVPVFVKTVGENVILEPRSRLDPNAEYRATLSGRLKNTDGESPYIPGGKISVTFTTRADRSLAGAPPAVKTVIPGETDEVFEWTTFRVFFTEPVDDLQTSYGDSVNDEIALRRQGSNAAIPAQMYIAGPQIVIDPESDLLPSTEYELFISGNLRDAGGERLGTDAIIAYTIKSTNPRHTLLVEQCPTMGAHSSCPPVSDPAGLALSIFTGEGINTMVMNSTLLGRTQMIISGQLSVEMGTTFADSRYIPIVIRKGQKLYGEPLEAMLGGQIPSGLNTKKIVVTVLADAYGFMESSERAQGIDGAPVGLRFMLDAALNTTDPAANAQMGQAILGAQLVGQATVKAGGILYMEVTGSTSLQVLGEEMSVTISLAMQPPQGRRRTRPDASGPMLISSSPKMGEPRARLGEPIILNFDEPLSTFGADEYVTVSKSTGEKVEGAARINGSKLTFFPNWALDPLTDYAVSVSDQVRDVISNKSGIPRRVEFRTGASEATQTPPRIGSVDPGINSQYKLPAQMPVQVYFTQVMDPNTIVLDDTFMVRDYDTFERIHGTLKKTWTGAVFTPNEPFEPGRTYRLILTDDITNIAGVALDIDNDGEPGGAGGETQVTTIFQASRADGAVPVVLELLPLVDADGSGDISSGEKPADSNFFKIKLFDLFPEPSYAAGYMIAHIRPLEWNDDDPVLPIDLTDGIQLYATGTSLSLPFLSDKAGAPGLFDTGLISVKASEPGSADAVAGADGTPRMLVNMQTYFTVQNPTFNGLLMHDLGLSATGLLTFDSDGRMVANISGNARIGLQIPLINLTIPLPVTLKLRAASFAP